MGKKRKDNITAEEKIFLKMFHEAFAEALTAINKSHTHIVNGNTHYDYSNLNRDKKNKINCQLLTARRKCKATGISLGDTINRADELTAAAVQQEEKLRQQKQKDFLSKID